MDKEIDSGLDGDVIISKDITLTRDMYYNSLTINNGCSIYTNGYKIFSKKGILFK